MADAQRNGLVISAEELAEIIKRLRIGLVAELQPPLHEPLSLEMLRLLAALAEQEGESDLSKHKPDFRLEPMP